MSEDDDLSVTQFARKFRIEVAASLVAILRDPDASPTARANAAEKILTWSQGRPGAARPIVVTDLAAMSDDERMALLSALINFYRPNGFETLLQECVDLAIAQEAERQALEQERHATRPKITMRRTSPYPPTPSKPTPEPEIIPPSIDLTNVVPLSPGSSNANTAPEDLLYRKKLQAFQAPEPVTTSYRGASGILYQAEPPNHAMNTRITKVT